MFNHPWEPQPYQNVVLTSSKFWHTRHCERRIKFLCRIQKTIYFSVSVNKMLNGHFRFAPESASHHILRLALYFFRGFLEPFGFGKESTSHPMFGRELGLLQVSWYEVLFWGMDFQVSIKNQELWAKRRYLQFGAVRALARTWGAKHFSIPTCGFKTKIDKAKSPHISLNHPLVEVYRSWILSCGLNVFKITS